MIYRRLLIELALLCLASSGVLAAVPQDDAPTVESINQALEKIGDSTGLEAAALKDTYQQTLDVLKRTNDAAMREAKYAAEAAEAPALLVSMKKELATSSMDVKIEPLDDPTVDKLQATVDKNEAALGAARKSLADLVTTAQTRASRKGSIPGEIATAQQALSAVQESLNATPNDEDSAPRRGLLLAEIELYNTELEALSTEREAYDARADLLPLRRDRAKNEVDAAEKRTEQWRNRLTAFRQQDGKTAAEKAQAKFTDILKEFPELEPLAAANKELADLRSGENSLSAQLAIAQSALDNDSTLLVEIQSRFKSAARRSELGSLSESTGFTLRRDYEWLPREAFLRTQAEERAKALASTELEELERSEQRALLSDPDAAARSFLAAKKVKNPDALAEASSLLEAQRDSLGVVTGELSDLTGILLEHVEKGAELRAEAGKYRAFIEQKILWVRSSRSGFIESVLTAPEDARALAKSISGGQLGEDVRSELRNRAGLFTVVLILSAFLLLGRRYLRKKREQMGKMTRSYKTDRYIFTMRALVQSLLIALPLPLLGWFTSKVLSATSVDLARAAGSALLEISILYLVLRFVGVLLAEKGVGNAHFRWAPAKTEAARRVVHWATPIAAVSAFGAFTFDRLSVTEWSDSLGRLCFIAAMGTLSVALHRLLRPESALWGDEDERRDGVLSRNHRWWSLLAAGIPVALIVLAISGYYYTALQLELRARYSLGLALALVLINALLLRWLFIARRRLAVSQALEARAQKDKEREEDEEVGEAAQAALDAEKIDIPAIDAQTRQLFRSSIILSAVLGLYLIWAASLPALQGLKRVQLLPYPAIVASSDTDTGPTLVSALTPAAAPDKPDTAGTPTPLRPLLPAAGTGSSGQDADTEPATGIPSSLTLADVVLAAILTLLTSVAARNLPALLELALLQRLPLDGGSRYAVTTLLRYLIIIIGVSGVSGALGIGWKHIQWLVAALTFGLAFGLQEIFANFISGIIILVERPIRVGDIVTVGTTEGRVTRLRMRATTILDWDRKEYLVPNKEFITSSVVNWTLSDPITRIVITVGIAYGSDTNLARSLLVKVAKKNSLVVDDPEPSALFRRFGDSTLDFELRVFVENRDVWPQLIDQLHTQIDKAFREADIEIAFPQRDLHLRSAPESIFGQRGEDDAPPKVAKD